MNSVEKGPTPFHSKIANAFISDRLLFADRQGKARRGRVGRNRCPLFRGKVTFPGTGIQGNLADKARALGIPVWKFGSSGA